MQSRALAAEYPVGDAFDGPAYGKKAMPLVAIVAAVGSFIAGAGIATAAGATMGAMIAGGAMMVGAALTIVGTVTGNANLSKWGGILSLAGGVGALGLSMADGLTSAATDATTSASADAATNATDAAITNAESGTASQGASLYGAGANADTATGMLSSDLGGATPDLGATAPAMPPVAAPPAATPTPPAPTPGSDALATGSPGALNAPTPSTNSAYVPAGSNPFDSNAAGSPEGWSGVSAGPDPTTNLPASSGNWWGSFSQWAKDNPQLARAGFQGATGLLSSLAPSAQNRYAAAAANNQQTQADIAAMKAGTKPGWWYGAPTGG
jgi:hypothetical protein